MYYSNRLFIKRLNSILLKHLRNEDFNIEFLAQEMELSRSQVHRKIRALTQLSPSDYVRQFRLKIAAKLLSKPNKSISQVAYAVGFNNLSYFTRSFKREFGRTPVVYVRQELFAKGM